jgi:hypothetical protein
MMDNLRADDHEGVLHVARNMREWDRREIYATRWSDAPEDLAEDIRALRSAFWVAYWNDVPAAAIGVVPVRPKVWSPWCFGTEDFPRVVLGLTKLAKRGIVRSVRYAGGHRMEVKSLDGHTDAQRWLVKCFGAAREGTHPGYGKNGETFHTYGVEV